MAISLDPPISVLSVPAVEHGDSMWVRELGPDETGRNVVHHQHQIVWVSNGPATVHVGDGHWDLPSTEAIWIPSGMTHELVSGRGLTLHGLSVPASCSVDWREPVVLAITPMLRELLRTLSAPGVQPRVSPATATLLCSLLKPLSRVAMRLPLPTEYRARALAQALLVRPADPRTLDEWADRFDTSASSLGGAFLDETGLTFAEWRTQSRLRASLGLLAEGVPPEIVAGKVGYDSPDDFVDAFRRHFGHSPGRHRKHALA